MLTKFVSRVAAANDSQGSAVTCRRQGPSVADADQAHSGPATCHTRHSHYSGTAVPVLQMLTKLTADPPPATQCIADRCSNMPNAERFTGVI